MLWFAGSLTSTILWSIVIGCSLDICIVSIFHSRRHLRCDWLNFKKQLRNCLARHPSRINSLLYSIAHWFIDACWTSDSRAIFLTWYNYQGYDRTIWYSYHKAPCGLERAITDYPKYAKQITDAAERLQPSAICNEMVSKDHINPVKSLHGTCNRLVTGKFNIGLKE